MFEFCNKMYINNLNAFIKIEINDQNSVFDKSCIASKWRCHAFLPLPDLHNSLGTRLLKQQKASANKRCYQRAQIVISKFLHFTVWVAHIHSHGHKFKTNHLMHWRTHAIPLTCRYTGKGCAQVNTQSPSLPLCHTLTHTQHTHTHTHNICFLMSKSFAVVVPEEESGSVCPKWLAYLCTKLILSFA